jgi:hypothetical protein
MAQHDPPRRIRDPRTGASPEPPAEARSDDPIHGVDPRRRRSAPGERPGLSGEVTHRGAMQTADRGRFSRRLPPSLWLVLFLAALVVAATFLWV